ncbi:D-alanine--D-alanine ligase [Eremococcus coleocola]|uniref:D-alanine--D-alanine ligase n=1 Tax=Eremococcus coleocola TaxID=88132 RepID=UPI000426C7A5|nr:D-alanine--D-alanine ligase [Eremococcus coleocola]
MKIIVLYGGLSPEHDISILSATNVINALLEADYSVQPYYINKEGKWLKAPLVTEKLESDTLLQLKQAHAASWGDGQGLTSTGVWIQPGQIAEDDAVVFPVLHGPNGEDGTIQGFLEVLNLPYVGAGVTASATGMDKIISKQLFDQAGLPQVPYVYFDKRDWLQDQSRWIQKCEGNLLYPFFVKPANMGSSVGVSRVENSQELIKAVDVALEFDRRIVVEQGISANECEVAVLGNDDIHASVVGRLVKSSDFYDYDEKYINNTVEMEIPANLPEAVSDKIKDYALKAYRAVDGTGLTRADFFVTANYDIYINEVNTMPGFTQFSMYPSLWQATGLNYRDLIDELIQLAIRRHQAKASIRKIY